MPVLERQAIGQGKLGSIVFVQLWSGLPGGRHAVIYFKDCVITNERSGTYTERLRDYSHAATHLAVNPLTEEQVRDVLDAYRLPREEFCAACSCRLPLGNRFCTACGVPGPFIRATLGRPAPGSNAEPVLLIPYRTPAEAPASS